jgi:RNA polymerase sigma factor (TIGR02999 family)
MTTLLLKRMASGDSGAADELFPMLYGELHSLARGYMAGERRHHTLQPTALIHEAWLRLFGPDPQPYQNRGHFVGVAARAMRRVLIDHARKRGAEKRGGEAERLPLDVALDLFEDSGPDLLVLDEALERLAGFDPELSRMVELRYFGGVSAAEIAEGLGVSTRTVERGLKTAQAWLRAEMGPEDEQNPTEPVAPPGPSAP